MRLDDYTVGLICALPFEHAATTAILDEEHASLPLNLRDQNFYTLGRISQHNVVVASPPNGSAGSIAAAKVAANMLSTFKNLRFGLLIGIGSGIPDREHDVRLGDVVVGTARDAHGGVIQYDLGKVTAGGVVKQRGYLNEPPHALRRAVLSMRAREIFEPRLASDMSAIKAKLSNPSSFEYPGQEHDIYFLPFYSHSDFSKDCSKCDPARMIPRPARPDTRPVVHHGLIGSGNLVLKDGMMRSNFGGIGYNLLRDGGCRNQVWQRYSAMAAAAYAKGVLEKVHREAISNVPPALDHLDWIIDSSVDSDNTSNTSATLFDESDSNLIDKAIKEVAHILISNQRLKDLFISCVSRMTASVFQRHLGDVLLKYGRILRKTSNRPLAQAVAWILRRRRNFIGSLISKQIFLHPYESVDTRSQFDEISSSDLDRLGQLIGDRFGNTEPSLPIDRDQDGISDEIEAELDEDFPTEMSTLVDLRDLPQVLCTGEAYWEACKTMRSIVYPPPMKQLTKVLQRHVDDNQMVHDIWCFIDWQLLEYVGFEQVVENELGSVFTLTGDFERARAFKLRDYMCQRWTSGNIMLDAVKELVAAHHASRSFVVDEDSEITVTQSIEPDHDFTIKLLPIREGREQAVARITGRFSQILETLEQISWLATTLRPCEGGKLAVSEINFRMESYSKSLYRLSLLEQGTGPEAEPETPGQCWTSLFTESNLAYGFSWNDENWADGMIGLEIPFEVMAAFAHVEYPIFFGGRYTLAGNSSLLTPVMSSGNCIQWHYSGGEGRFTDLKDRLNKHDSKLATLDLEAWAHSRAFLGYYCDSEVLLGTRDFRKTEISESRVPQTGGKLTLALDGPVTASFSIKSHLQVNIGTTWKFRRRERAQIQPEQLSQDDYIRRSQGNSTLLYDSEASRAFLVSELSIILHMVCVYLQKRSQLPQGRIPYAEPSSDGGEAAYQIIRQEQDLIVPFGIGDHRRYLDIVYDFIKIFEHRKTQTYALQVEIKTFYNHGIRGWDFLDMQDKKYHFFERQLSAGRVRSKPVWWAMFRRSEILVVFGRNIGYPIRRAANTTNQPYCDAWVDLPTGKDLLLANVTSLIRSTESFNVAMSDSQPYLLVAEKLAWARPKQSRLFEPCQGGSCNPVQTLRKVGLWHRWSIEFDRNPGDIVQTGAVLFADSPADFEPRQCRLIHVAPKAVSLSTIFMISASCFSFAYILFLMTAPL